MRETLRAGGIRIRKWVRCHVFGLHVFDWREVFTTANETGAEPFGQCGDCGKRVPL